MKPLFPDVIVNGTTIPSAAIAAEAQNHKAPKDKPGQAWQAAARALAVRELLLQAAEKSGLTADPEARGPGQKETATEALIRVYISNTISPAPVTEADCRAVYEARPAKAAKLTYDETVRDIHESLERNAWANAARDLVGDLVEDAEIQGIDMVAKPKETEKA